MKTDFKYVIERKLPLFCDSCVNVRKGLLTGELYCRKFCRYNPEHIYQACEVHYKPASGVMKSLKLDI